MGLSAGSFLIGLAAILSGAGWIWLTVVAFRSGEKIWGWLLLASLILPIGPFVAIAFFVMRWSVARRPAILILSSLPLFLLGLFLVVRAGQTMAEEMATQMAAQMEKAARASDSRESQAAEAEPSPSTNRTAPAIPGSSRSHPSKEISSKPGRAGSVGDSPAAASPISTPPVATGVSTEVSPATPPHRSPAEPERDPARPPVALVVVELGEPSPNQLRKLLVRARNEDQRAVHELKIELEYLDRRGVRLGRWTTVHADTNAVLSGSASNIIELQAFFVPQFTKSVRLGVEGVTFADGTRWPSPE